METKDLGKKLKELRTLRGMSQEYLAEESQVSLRTIQRIENNESKPTGETIKRIAVAIEANIQELIGQSAFTETSDLKGTIIFLKKKLSQATKRSEIRVFERFISVLENLKEKDLNERQLDNINSYIEYLELEKIPSFSNEVFKQKLKKFRTFLNTKLRFVPTNHYVSLAIMFTVPFATPFAILPQINADLKIGIISAAILVMGIAHILDLRIKRQNRSLRF